MATEERAGVVKRSTMNSAWALAISSFLFFSLFFMVLSLSVLVLSSASVLEIEEEELIRLTINASDPDGDLLTAQYSTPLNENGTWQTKLGDEGDYNIAVTVVDSNGERVTQNITLRILHKNIPPPSANQTVEIREGELLSIMLPNESRRGILADYTAKLPEGAELHGNILSWRPSFTTAQANPFFMLPLLHKWGLLSSFSLEQKRSIEIPVVGITENRSTESMIIVQVINSNRAPVFIEPLRNMTVAEGETLTIPYTVSDPDEDKLYVFFSGLIKKNGARIGYDDAGEQNVELKLSDGMIQVTEQIPVTVQNTNRAPELLLANTYRVREGTNKSITLRALDPDDDALRFSLLSGPSFATVRNSTLFLAPDFDAVTGGETRSTVPASILVSDGDLNASKEINIEAENQNRAPMILSTSPDPKIIVKRGQVLNFSVTTDDLDGDELSYAWSGGFFDNKDGKETHRRKFSEPGVKTFSVAVSDGDLSVEHEWKILVR